MDFIQSSNKQVDKFGAGKHGFSAGNPVGGILATYLNNLWCDGVQQEIINVIEAAGLVPSGAALNQLLQAIRSLRGFARFTSSGNWVCPAGVTTAYVWGCGGGGGGGGCQTVGTPNIVSGGGGGGAGTPATCVPLTVVPGTNYPVTIGAAGAAGAVGGAGGSGGATSLGALLTLGSGTGGGAGTGAGYTNYTAGAVGGAGAPDGSSGQDTGPVGVGASGGAGASSPFGGGGGATRGVTTGAAMVVGKAAAGGFGGGGGGAGGNYAAGNTTILTSTGAAGGAGAPGFLFIAW